jgi:hypothetical protein
MWTGAITEKSPGPPRFYGSIVIPGMLMGGVLTLSRLPALTLSPLTLTGGVRTVTIPPTAANAGAVVAARPEVVKVTTDGGVIMAALQ